MAEIYISGEIGKNPFTNEGLDADAFAKTLAKIPQKERLTIYVDSPGGVAFTGISIHNQISRWAGDVHVIVDGLAASAASLLIMAADHIEMAAGAFMMIHAPWTFAVGSAADLRKAIEVLEGLQKSYVSIYSGRSKLPEDEISAMLDNETWLDGSDAVMHGFADAYVETKNSSKAYVDVAPFNYKKVPELIAKAPVKPCGYNRHKQNFAINLNRIAAMKRNSTARKV